MSNPYSCFSGLTPLWRGSTSLKRRSPPAASFQQAFSGVVIATPGSTMPPRLPMSVPPYRSAKTGGRARPFGGQSHRRSRCRFRSGSGQPSSSVRSCRITWLWMSWMSPGLNSIQHSPEHLTGQAGECWRRVLFELTTDLADILTLRLEWIGSDVARRRIAIALVAGRDVIRLLAPGSRKERVRAPGAW
jgi:hypothetical protein